LSGWWRKLVAQLAAQIRRIGKYYANAYFVKLGLSGWWRKLVAQLAAQIQRIGKYYANAYFAKLGLSGWWRKLVAQLVAQITAHREILHQSSLCYLRVAAGRL